MDENVEQLRELIATNRPRVASTGYPIELRHRAGRYALAQHRSGESWAAIGAALGLSRTTVRSWATPESELGDGTGDLVPVVIGEPEPPVAAQPPPTLILVSPRGFRVEGLSLASMSELLERLG